jgi:hypothetical protein
MLIDSRVGAVDPVAELAPLGRVDVKSREVVGGEPGGGAGFVVGGGGAGDGAASEDDLVFLADFAVGVGDDVAGSE